MKEEITLESVLKNKTPIEKDIIGIHMFHSPNPDTNLCDACKLEYPCPHIRVVEELEKETERLDKLFHILPFEIRHKFGGDEKEFREGIDTAPKDYKIEI